MLTVLTSVITRMFNLHLNCSSLILKILRERQFIGEMILFDDPLVVNVVTCLNNVNCLMDEKRFLNAKTLHLKWQFQYFTHTGILSGDVCLALK